METGMASSTQGPPDLILWDVVEEHFNEAEFLFEQWERALHSPKYNLTELGATLERRLAAHLDGLVVGGRPVAKRTLEPELENASEPNRTIVAALALLFMEEEKRESGDNRPVRFTCVLQFRFERALGDRPAANNQAVQMRRKTPLESCPKLGQVVFRRVKRALPLLEEEFGFVEVLLDNVPENQVRRTLR